MATSQPAPTPDSDDARSALPETTAARPRFVVRAARPAPTSDGVVPLPRAYIAKRGAADRSRRRARASAEVVAPETGNGPPAAPSPVVAERATQQTIAVSLPATVRSVPTRGDRSRGRWGRGGVVVGAALVAGFGVSLAMGALERPRRSASGAAAADSVLDTSGAEAPSAALPASAVALDSTADSGGKAVLARPPTPDSTAGGVARAVAGGGIVAPLATIDSAPPVPASGSGTTAPRRLRTGRRRQSAPAVAALPPTTGTGAERSSAGSDTVVTSTSAEEEAIRREIAERKARVDSLTEAIRRLGPPRP